MNSRNSKQGKNSPESRRRFRFFIWQLLTIEGEGYEPKDLRRMIRTVMNRLVFVVFIMVTGVVSHPPMKDWIVDFFVWIVELVK